MQSNLVREINNDRLVDYRRYKRCKKSKEPWMKKDSGINQQQDTLRD